MTNLFRKNNESPTVPRTQKLIKTLRVALKLIRHVCRIDLFSQSMRCSGFMLQPGQVCLRAGVAGYENSSRSKMCAEKKSETARFPKPADLR